MKSPIDNKAMTKALTRLLNNLEDVVDDGALRPNHCTVQLCDGRHVTLLYEVHDDPLPANARVMIEIPEEEEEPEEEVGADGGGGDE